MSDKTLPRVGTSLYEDESSPSTPLLQHQHKQDSCHGNKNTREFPILRAKVIAVLMPMLMGSAAVSSSGLIAQYLVSRLGDEQNKTGGHHDVCTEVNLSQQGNATEKDLEAQAADLMSGYALAQTVPAMFACLLLGSYSDVLGRRKLLLVPAFTGVFKQVMLSLIIQRNLSLNFIYVAYAVDGVAGSWFAILIALYALTADVNSSQTSRTFSIFAIMCCTNIAQAGVSIATSDLIATLGFFDASLLISSINAASFFLPLFLLPETLHYQQYLKQKELSTGYGQIQDRPLAAQSETDGQRLEGHWINPMVHLRRLFGFYVLDGSRRQRVEMCLLLLAFMLFVSNEINQSSLDALYQMHKPFCWGPEKIGTYQAIRSAGSNVLGALWLAALQKCFSLEVLGNMGVFFQSMALAFEGLVQSSWQFYLVPVLMIPAVAISAVVRTLLSIKVGPDEQGALFSSIAVMESFCTLISTTSYNKVYSATAGLALHGAVYLVMASCALLAAFLFIAYMVVREKPRETSASIREEVA